MNYHQIKQTVNSLTDEQKTELLESITVYRGVYMLMGKKVNKRLLNYAVALLKGENPDKPLVFRRPRRILNSKVRIIREANNGRKVLQGR